MKILKLLIPGIFMIFLGGCNDGYIDDITRVDPGADESAPTVTINYPLEGTEIQVYESVTTINIDFKVTDDIEVQSIKLMLDGSELTTMTEFKDYRNVASKYAYDNLGDGEHELSIMATDIDGKSTSKTVHFEKVPPYVPKYDGEVLYMPFNGDFIDLVSVTYPTIKGTPGFAGEGVAGGNAYKGASGAYLTFPVADLTDTHELTAEFWMKINATPERGGILVIGPDDTAHPDAQNDRTKGFRFFREPGAAGMQRFKLNVGTGASDSWFDGNVNADVDPGADVWHHFAFSIAEDQATVYIDGEVVSQGALTNPIDWTGTDVLSIMSGAPHFTEWGHLADESWMDELRIFDRALSQEEIQGIIMDDGGDVSSEFGEMFYMPFDGDYIEAFSGSNATKVGSPGFAGEGLRGDNAYKGAAGSYLTFPAGDLMNDEFSASFWYKLNPDPERGGILVIGPPDPDNPDKQNLRTSGFRFFREPGAEGMQRFKLNVGTGAAEKWFDGGAAADVDPSTTTGWIHIAFAISQSEGTVWINGQVVSTDAFDGIDWTNCDILSIGSGAPRFTGWDHNSDLSSIDELRIFDRAITQSDVDAIINAE